MKSKENSNQVSRPLIQSASISKYCVFAKQNVADAIRKLDQTMRKALLVTDDNSRLCGSISDGDIRRALLRGEDLSSLVSDVMNKEPIFVRPETEAAVVKTLMGEHSIEIIPCVTEDKQISSAWILKTATPVKKLDNRLLIMAGGFGKRLAPLTDTVPKPMIRVGGKPLLERIIENAASSGLRNIVISVFHMHEQIIEYFGDGREFNVKIEYVFEEKPLGTAGALSLLEESSEKPLAVMNGDIFCELNFQKMLDFHHLNKASITIGVVKHEMINPYGVIVEEEGVVTQILEKPKNLSKINGGCYILSPDVLIGLPKNEPFQMTDLIENSILQKKKVVTFDISAHWVDIGRREDLLKVERLFEELPD